MVREKKPVHKVQMTEGKSALTFLNRKCYNQTIKFKTLFTGDLMKIYDTDIRKILYSNFKKIDEYTSTPDTITVNEMDICSGIARADIVVINGQLHGYEIKSQQDNLERLPRQISYYNQVFDTMTIVAFQTHIEKIKELVPKWWGIQSVFEKNGEIKLKNNRKARINKKTSIQNIALLLWRDEMIDLLYKYSNVKRGYKSKTRYELSLFIEEHVDPLIVKEYVKQTLKSRTNWKSVPILQLDDDLLHM